MMHHIEILFFEKFIIIIIIIIIIKLLFIIIIKILFNEKFIHLFIHVMAKFSSRVLYL